MHHLSITSKYKCLPAERARHCLPIVSKPFQWACLARSGKPYIRNSSSAVSVMFFNSSSPVIWASAALLLSLYHTTTGCLKCRCSGHLKLLLFLVFIERVKAVLLTWAGLGTKSFYMDAIMEARFSPFGFGGSYHVCPLHSYPGLPQRSTADLPPLRPGLAHYCIFQTMYNW